MVLVVVVVVVVDVVTDDITVGGEIISFHIGGSKNFEILSLALYCVFNVATRNLKQPADDARVSKYRQVKPIEI